MLSPPQKASDKLAVCLTLFSSAEHSFMQRMKMRTDEESFVAVSRLIERSYGVPKQHDAGETISSCYGAQICWFVVT
jgi:hypothetical protein